MAPPSRLHPRAKINNSGNRGPATIDYEKLNTFRSCFKQLLYLNAAISLKNNRKLELALNFIAISDRYDDARRKVETEMKDNKVN